MAQRGIQPDSAKFFCSICLDLLKDPVTLPCGHSYCMSCIKDCWDGEDHKEIYSCPQCKQTFTPRPVLEKSTTAIDIVEEMKKMGLQAAPPDLCYAGPGDVAGDFTHTEKDVKVPQQEVEAQEPKTRAELLQYSCHITLDPNTANTELSLSKGNRKATRMAGKQSSPSHPDRFTFWPQVLSTESLTGRCYWEVKRKGAVDIAVSYQDISRTGDGDKCLFGHNKKSWSLFCSNKNCDFNHNSIITKILLPVSSRVGVYLDHRAGILSFYSVSETMTLLHRVQTTFTQPLHAGLGLCSNAATAEFCELK